MIPRAMHESSRHIPTPDKRTIMGRMRGFWILITLFAAACGSSAPPAPSTGTGGSVESITGRERVGWDQPAADAVELASFSYVIYVDDSRSGISDTVCASTSGSAGFACSGKLPPLSSGAHKLELATVSTADSGESKRSNPLQVVVSAALTADSAPPLDWQSGEVDPTQDGVRLRVDKVAESLARPTDAAFSDDGRLFIGDVLGRIQVLSGGKLQAAPALSLPAEDGQAQPVLAIAFDPDFLHTGFVFVLHAGESSSGPAVYLSRYRELRGILAQRAVLFTSAIDSVSDASAVMRFGPDRKLYLAIGSDPDGKVLRLNADGTRPADQAGTTPAIAGGVVAARGLAWDWRTAILWIVDEDATVAHLSGMSLSAPPVRASVRARRNMRLGAGSIVFYTGSAIPEMRDNALIASQEGYILRVRFTADDPTIVKDAERLLDNRVGPIRVVTVGPDGAVYFATDTALGRLSAIR
jgi:glucose/arabinose dehydrogenase